MLHSKRPVNRYLRSAGRNTLLREVKTKYFVLLDDDFIFTENTDLNEAEHIINETECDILEEVD